MVNTQKKFEHSGLTHSAAHHLLAVAELLGGQGYARVTDIARRLGLTRGSVSVAMQSLRAGGHVEQDASHFFHLTDEGQRAAAGLKARHAVVEQFLTDVLSLSAEQAHRESCRVENLIDSATTRRLFALVEYWQEKDLGDVLTERLTPACPVCKGEPDAVCPCCGLECLDGVCPLAQTKSIDQGSQEATPAY
ncbi:MAG: metal-dependent transcriptional regulator [Planctomycetota bacterium]|jgi:Mn-dependent DtxR family transcriptional regulator